MRGEELSPTAHIVHYVSPSKLTDTGEVSWTTFRNKVTGKCPSAWWLEVFSLFPPGNQLNEIRSLANAALTIKKKGRLVEIVIEDLKSCGETLKVIHMPKEKACSASADPAHCDIKGIPPFNSPSERDICEKIAKIVKPCFHKAIVCTSRN